MSDLRTYEDEETEIMRAAQREAGLPVSPSPKTVVFPDAPDEPLTPAARPHPRRATEVIIQHEAFGEFAVNVISVGTSDDGLLWLVFENQASELFKPKDEAHYVLRWKDKDAPQSFPVVYTGRRIALTHRPETIFLFASDGPDDQEDIPGRTALGPA